MILNMNWQMLQKVTKCYFEPLPQLSYIYWLIHFKTEYLLDNVWPFKNSYFVPCLLNTKCRSVSWNGTVTSDIRHFVYLNHVLMLTNDEPVKNLYYQQLQLVFEEKWANKIHGWFWWKRLKQVYEFFFLTFKFVIIIFCTWKPIPSRIGNCSMPNFFETSFRYFCSLFTGTYDKFGPYTTEIFMPKKYLQRKTDLRFFFIYMLRIPTKIKTFSMFFCDRWFFKLL